MNTKVAYKRWTKEEEEVLKDIFIQGRQINTPHKLLWEQIANALSRSPSEVQRKLIRMYKTDEDLKNLKQENWSRAKILDNLRGLYLNGDPINKNDLPDKLKFILLKVTPPSAPEHRAWFNSLDEALAEAVQSCGYERGENGLDYDRPLDTIEDAIQYIRRGHKKRHEWTLDEVRDILTTLNDSDYPITLAFLTNHYDLYKNALGVNRKLESFKDVVKKFVNDGRIESYADLVCSIAPDYSGYYNTTRSRLKLSTEEIRVKKFLDRWRIPYVIPKLSDKLPTGLDRFANFVPDFVLLGSDNNPTAIVEVFGSIGDRENAGVNELYQEKTEAKLNFYKSIPDMRFIEVYNNQGRCDLDDDTLFSRFGCYISLEKTATEIDAQDIIASDYVSLQKNMKKYGCSIVYHPERDNNYSFVNTAGLDFKFDSLHELPELDPDDPILKSLIEKMIEAQRKPEYKRKKHPGEQEKDYAPRQTPFDYDHNRWISYKDVRFR